MVDGARTFLITRVSSGLGRTLARAAVGDGNRVVGTVRQAGDAEAFESVGRLARAEVLDVTDDAAVAAAVDRTEAGPIDVVVANAGYGQEGTMEEPVRRERLRRGGDDQGRAAGDARASLRPRDRDHLAGRADDDLLFGGLIYRLLNGNTPLTEERAGAIAEAAIGALLLEAAH